MNEDRERRYLQAQKYIVVMWIIIGLIFFAEKVFACTATYMHETTSGMHRICFYNHLGSTVPYAVPVSRTCPLTVEISHE